MCKIRTGFVSNSSSSSFVVQKSNITPKQLDQIRNHRNRLPVEEWNYDSWELYEDDDKISGQTSMDNFCMPEYFSDIGINDKDVEWEND